MAILKPDSSATTSTGLLINEYLLTNHNPNKIDLPAKRTAPLIGVTLHNTGWINVASSTTAAEQYTRATVNGSMKSTRIHYYVDNKCAWRNFGDDYTCWHAATGGQGQGNANTISIECIMKGQTDAESVESMDNAAKLIAHIFKQYGWTVEKNLYTHNYWTNYLLTGKTSTDLDRQSLNRVSASAVGTNGKKANPNGKYCPVYILPQWEKFKGMINSYLGKASTTPAAPPKKESTPEPPSLYRVRNANNDPVTQIGAFTNLDNAIKACKAGYCVFDYHGNVVYSLNNVTANTDTSTTTPKTNEPLLALESVAREVIGGFYGNGEERKNKLTAKGYNVDNVQKAANAILANKPIPNLPLFTDGQTTPPSQPVVTKKSNEEIAEEVIAGIWGNGADRKAKLKNAGYDPDTIQKLVNKLI